MVVCLKPKIVAAIQAYNEERTVVNAVSKTKQPSRDDEPSLITGEDCSAPNDKYVLTLKP